MRTTIAAAAVLALSSGATLADFPEHGITHEDAMNANDYPTSPFVLNAVMGAIVEQNFMTSMLMSDGSLAAFFTLPSPACSALLR